MNGNRFLREKIDYMPNSYISDDALYGRLSNGEILKHRKDFYLISNDSDWKLFLENFTCGIVLKYKPDPDNPIDTDELQRLQKKQVEKPEQATANPQEKVKYAQEDESKLINKNKRFNKKKKDKTPSRKAKKPAFLKYLDDETQDENGASVYSAGGESESRDVSNPEFLKGQSDHKQRGEGISSEEEESKHVTPRNGKKNRRKESSRNNLNHTPKAYYEGGNAMNQSFINPKVGNLQSFQKEKRGKYSKKQATTPRMDDNPFERTFIGKKALLLDGNGKSLRKASDASDEEYKIREYRDSHRSESPTDEYENKYGSVDIFKNVGLENPNNDCFMNASFQVLFSVPELMVYFVNRKYDEDRLSRDKLMLNDRNSSKAMKLSGYKYCNALSNLCIEVASGDYDIIRARNLRSIRNMFKGLFSKNQQHDANEFILNLFSNIQDEQTPKSSKFISDECTSGKDAWRRYMANYNSIIDKLFVGMLQISFRCGKCKNVVHRYESFTQIELECKRNTLEKAYNDYLSDEIMKKNQSYRCEKCRKVVKCRIMREIVKMPKYLIFYFKRFYSNRGKISDKITYPDSILMEDKLSTGDLKYHLQAVVLHSGGLSSGHYTSMAKKSEKWVNFNDSHWRTIKSKQVIHKDAYVLLYKRG